MGRYNPTTTYALVSPRLPAELPAGPHTDPTADAPADQPPGLTPLDLTGIAGAAAAAQAPLTQTIYGHAWRS